MLSDSTMLKRIADKLDKMDDRLDSIDKTLVSHDVQLKEHMRRSLANEENVELLRKEFKPVSTHVAVVGALAKVVLGLATIASAIAAVLKLVL